jgi:hypothetical protein
VTPTRWYLWTTWFSGISVDSRVSSRFGVKHFPQRLWLISCSSLVCSNKSMTNVFTEVVDPAMAFDTIESFPVHLLTLLTKSEALTSCGMIARLRLLLFDQKLVGL